MPTVHGGQVYGAARAVGLSHDAAVTATAIARAESSWNTDAHNGTGRDDSYGLWQINRKAHGDRFGTGAQLRDIMVNARAMAALSAGGTTWQPWAAYTGPDGVGSDGPWRAELVKAREAAAAVILPPNTAAGWESVARRGAGIKRSASITNVPDIVGGLVADGVSDPIGTAGRAADAFTGGLVSLDPMEAIGRLVSTLLDSSWWRRLGVGALGVLVLVAGLVFLGRDLATDTARSILTGGDK